MIQVARKDHNAMPGSQRHRWWFRRVGVRRYVMAIIMMNIVIFRMFKTVQSVIRSAIFGSNEMFLQHGIKSRSGRKFTCHNFVVT